MCHLKCNDAIYFSTDFYCLFNNARLTGLAETGLEKKLSPQSHIKLNGKNILLFFRNKKRNPKWWHIWYEIITVKYMTVSFNSNPRQSLGSSFIVRIQFDCCQLSVCVQEILFFAVCVWMECLVGWWLKLKSLTCVMQFSDSKMSNAKFFFFYFVDITCD